MGIVGVNFIKLGAERSVKNSGQLRLNSNVHVKSVEKHELTVGGKKQQTLQFNFNFTVKYEPKAGNINLQGFLTYVDSNEKITELAKQWKKGKKLPEEVMIPVMNSILTKSNIMAILLTREINLPSPVQFPKVKAK